MSYSSSVGTSDHVTGLISGISGHMVKLPADIAKTVEPFPIPEVRDEHMPTMFADFRAVLRARIGELRARKAQASNVERFIEFYEFLLEDVETGKFAAMQTRFLNTDNPNFDHIRDYVKYIDPIVWHESKLATCLRYGLEKMGPLKILDIGTGPGHFQVVCRFLGHDVVGTEIPKYLDACSTDERALFYDAFADIYRLKRLPCRIEPCTRLPDLGRRYDLVTAFLAAFNFNRERKSPWDLEEWRFFLMDLKTNVLSEGGGAIFVLAQNKLSPTVWEFLAEHAVDSDPRTLRLRFENFDWLD